MNTSGRAVANLHPRSILCWMAVACLCALPLFAQTPAATPAAAGNAGGSGSAAGIRAITILDGQWRFQTGDDPRWADPAFYDSSWPSVSLSTSLAEQGIDTYTG